MESFWQDIRYGLRMLLKAPGFSLVAIAALALGIGANTAIFSVVNAVILRPLPFEESNRLMMVFHSYPGIGLSRATISPVTWDYYTRNMKSFESMGVFTSYKVPRNLTGSGDPERVRSAGVSGGFFQTLRARPMLGRTISEGDDQPGHERVVVLGYGIWKNRFGADRGIVGRTITLDGNNYDVIGVMPAEFQYPSTSELWVPLAFTPEERQKVQVEYLNMIGRMKPGVTRQQVDAEMAAMTRGIRETYAKEFEGDTSGWHVIAEPMTDVIRGDLRRPLLVLLAAVGCVLLIACVNVANLLLARATARHKEIATRLAIGATRLRLIRQLLTESVVLGIVGGVFGLMLGSAGVQVLLRLLPIELPTFIKIDVDPMVMGFTLAVSIGTGLLFGLVPAFQISMPRLADELKEGRSQVGSSRHRLRDLLVIGEMGLAVLLLIGGGLMIRSFVRIQQTRFGFDTNNVLTFAVSLPQQKYKDPSRTIAFADQALQRINNLPGVESAATGSSLPLEGGWTSSYEIQGKSIQPAPHTFFAVVSPQYFRTLGIQLLRGRTFTESDRENSQLVAILDERAAKQYFGNENPIGQHILYGRMGQQKPEPWEIVGVVAPVKHSDTIADETKGQTYLPYTQEVVPGYEFAIRTKGDPAAIGASARSAIHEIDPEMPLYDVRTMEERMAENLAQPRFNTVLLGVFGGLALVLAAVGIYGVLSYTVTQRTHEIGLRMALGAQQGDVLKMVMNHALRLAGTGIAAGIVAALIASKALATLLFHISRTDPVTYIGIVVILGGVALLASFAPARRATRVDPMVALRNE